MADLVAHVGPSPESQLRFRRIRARIVRGLVQLAAAEPDRGAGPGAGDGPGLPPEPRRDLLRQTLGSLDEALAELSGVVESSDSGRAPGDPERAALRRTLREASGTVRELLGEIDTASPDRLLEIPERARGPLSSLVNEWCPVRKLFLAVHGIGDQFHNETVQSVAFRVCDYVGQPAALPLGRFHGPGAAITGTFLPDPDRDPPLDCGFAEIYWADVPRVPAADQHILEEPTKWARALVERLQLHAPDDPTAAAPLDARSRSRARRNDERLERLLEELIQGVVVADRLVFLAEKAGLFQFDLKKMLNDYLNDVQVVTEFEDYRLQLLDIFEAVFEKIHRYFGASEVYIVAHSEGTVVSFMGLLSALSRGAPWVGMVRGLMTIGSPLNKHVRFWPELFDQYAPPAEAPPRRIAWKNYYDYGDPIGYDLAPTRAWMAERGWAGVFEFRDVRDDIGFTRYYFPGAAHNDYWKDPDVFGHFLQEVVDPPGDVLPRTRAEPYGVPRGIRLARLTSYALPYALALALLALACFLLYKADRSCVDPIGARFESTPRLLANVAGLTGLVAGMSLLARIPRLTGRRSWRVVAGLLATSSLLYVLMSPEDRQGVERFLDVKSHARTGFDLYNLALVDAIFLGLVLMWVVESLRPILRTLLPVVVWVLVLRLLNDTLSGSLPRLPSPFTWHALAVISVAWAIGLMAAVTSWVDPEYGTRPLVHTGGLVLLLIIATQVAFHPHRDRAELARAVTRKLDAVVARLSDRVRADPEHALDDPRPIAEASSLRGMTDAAVVLGPIWPLVLAAAAFLYLWWIAIITFDLAFVWHLYIRHAGAQQYVEGRIRRARLARQSATPPLGPGRS